MQCDECGKWNDESAKFCKECGKRLPKPPVREEGVSAQTQARIGELIYSAHRHQESGNLEEAILACGGALALNENSAPTHMFLGSLYEGRGELQAAVRQYRRALELDPGNSSAKEKIDGIIVGSGKSAIRPANLRKLYESATPYFPHVAAAFALTIVMIMGIYFAFSISEKRRERFLSSQVSESNKGTQIVAPVFSNPQPVYSQQPSPSAILPPEGNNIEIKVPEKQEPVKEDVRKPSEKKEVLPPVPMPEPLEPIAVKEEKKETNKPKPVIVPIIEPSESGNKPGTEEKNTGSISITPAPVKTSVNHEENASRYHQNGQYEEALTEYNLSLGSAKDKGRIYQQMALCNTRLTRYTEAEKDYNKAIEAYRNQLNSGGDKSAIEINIKSCEIGLATVRQMQGSSN